MARFFFHIYDGKSVEDRDGVECLDPDEARIQAICTAGEILKDQSHQPWLGNAWQMRVEEEGGRTVCTLTVTVE